MFPRPPISQLTDPLCPYTPLCRSGEGDARGARVARQVPFRAGCERRRRDVKAAAPDLDLIVAMLRRGLGLVEPGEPAIVTFIEAPVLGDGEPEAPHRLERQVQRLDRARLDRGEAGVGRYALRLHQLARRTDEHTAELQSLLRTSYAVICMHKRN